MFPEKASETVIVMHKGVSFYDLPERDQEIKPPPGRSCLIWSVLAFIAWLAIFCACGIVVIALIQGHFP